MKDPFKEMCISLALIIAVIKAGGSKSTIVSVGWWA